MHRYMQSKPSVLTIIVCLSVVYGHFCPLSTAQDSVADQHLIDDLQSRVLSLHNQVVEHPGDTELLLRYAELLEKSGDYKSGLETYREILLISPDAASATVGAARILTAANMLDEAQTLLTPAGSSPAILVARGDVHLKLRDYSLAESFYYEALSSDEDMAEAHIGLAFCARVRGDTAAGELHMKRALEIDDQLPEILTAYAMTAMEERNLDRAEQYLQTALRADPYHSESRGALGYIYFRKGDMKSCVRELKLAVRFNPYNFTAHRHLGRGMNADGYPDEVADSEFDALILSADRVASKNPAAARLMLSSSLEQYTAQPRLLTELAFLCLRLNEEDNAIEYAQAALELCPSYSMAHFAISQALNRRLRRQDELSNSLRSTIMDREIAEPEGLRDVFVNYDTLSDEYRKMVLVSIEPLKGFLNELHTAGGRHFVMPLNMRMWQVPLEQVPERGTRTFDGRLWDDVKGVGGLHAVTGESAIRTALDGGFNILAHEFAHQVHINALPETIKKEIEGLYQKALKSGRTLDYYAAANELEYFAQGVEAYVSTVKGPELRGTSGHSRQERVQNCEEHPDIHGRNCCGWTLTCSG
jgi:tetratricopeptide (TPR) repeat protein